MSLKPKYPRFCYFWTPNFWVIFVVDSLGVLLPCPFIVCCPEDHNVYPLLQGSMNILCAFLWQSKTALCSRQTQRTQLCGLSHFRVFKIYKVLVHGAYGSAKNSRSYGVLKQITWTKAHRTHILT